MMKFTPIRHNKTLSIIVFASAWLVLLCYSAARAYDSAGISLDIYVDQGDEDLTYNLADPNDPVTILLVIKNISSRAVDTERGFSQGELYHSLIVTTPEGAKFSLRPTDESHKMPLPFFINEKAWSLAEKLPVQWVKSAKVNDLRTYVPGMSKTAGWYTIEAQRPFMRFAVTGQFSSLGLMGEQENANNWSGIVSSKKIQIYIKPPGGAQFDVQVYDNSTDPPERPFRVPVRVFKTEDVPGGYTVEDKWNNLEYVLEEFTNEEGKVTLTTAAGCFSQDNYTLIARYADEYQETAVDSADDNWVSGGCGGMIAKVFEFTGAPPPAVPGDLDGDGDVDYDDYLIFRTTYGVCEGNEKFIPKADLDTDGCVTINDYRILRTLIQ
jgi:hypothetical protein